MSLNPYSYNAIFIDEKSFKDYSLVNENVDMKLLKPVIKMVQETVIIRYLGTGLYVDLQNKIAGVYQDGTSGNTLTADDVFLLNAYITPMMVWAVMQKVGFAITYKFMNKGVEKQSSDNSSPATTEELQTLKDEASHNFDMYAKNLIFYLQGNTAKYPQYMVVKNIDDIAPTMRGYNSKTYIGNNKADGQNVCDPRFYFR